MASSGWKPGVSLSTRHCLAQPHRNGLVETPGLGRCLAHA